MTTHGAPAVAVEGVAVTVEATVTATDDVMLARRVRAAPLVTSSPSSVVALDEDVVAMLLLLSRKAIQAGMGARVFQFGLYIVSELGSLLHYKMGSVMAK